MFQSLKVQFVFALASLFLVLFIQLYLSHETERVLLENQELVGLSVVKIERVHDLERIVLDLQRNVLIYKETGSDFSVTNVANLLASVNITLDEVAFGLADSEVDVGALKNIATMRGHLRDYGDNFESVVLGRNKRNDLFVGVIQKELDRLANIIDNLEAKGNEVFGEASSLAIKYHVSQAKNISYQYVLAPDSGYESRFDYHMNLVLKYGRENDRFNKGLGGTISTLQRTFIQLAQATRGYMFLVNVVMAGSANEFLFLTKSLKRFVIDEQRMLNGKARVLAKKAQVKSGVFSAVCIFLTIFIGVFLVVRIILPIRRITDVFSALSRGEDVLKIPGISRRDEIGSLAQAADVFHKNNLVTTRLLEGAQRMNLKLEAVNSELAEEKHKAELAVKSKSMFLANMSHEIRTPMNGIVGLVDLALKSDLNEKQRGYLEKISYSGDIMMGVINDILDFSKIEAGRLEIENVEFNIDKILDNIISVLYLRVSEKNLNLRVNVDSNIPESYMGDPLRINQVLLNLCNNSIKFTERGQIDVRVDYQEVESEGAGVLSFEVIDSGIGMTSEQMAQIFDSFTQADGTTSRKFGGTGLGLAIVKQLSELMGGGVEVTSEVGKGSSFKVSVKVGAAGSRRIFNYTSYLGGDVECFYVPCKEGAFIDERYIIAAGLLAVDRPLPELLLGGDLCRPVLLDVPSAEYFRQNEGAIRELASKGARLGFVADTQSTSFGNFSLESALLDIKDELNVAVISHPFSPSQFEVFVGRLFGVEGGAIVASVEEDCVGAQLVGHVLLVEDNEINQLVAGDILEDMGLSYDVAGDGAQAVERVLEGVNQYDVVLMDIQMPVMDGYEATRVLRAKGYSDLIVCGLSANAMKEDYVRAEGAGMNDYVTKPIDPELLAETLKKYLPSK